MNEEIFDLLIPYLDIRDFNIADAKETDNAAADLVDGLTTWSNIRKLKSLFYHRNKQQRQHKLNLIKQ
jgi:hypothetical protein